MSLQLSHRQFPASILHLDNGLTVIHQEVSATPVVVVDVWVRAGSIVEPESWSGMAHFLEHMIFKGTDQIAPGVFDQLIECQGGMTNAATSHDYAHFYITTTLPYTDTAFALLSQILLNPKIPDEEFYREREVVLEELRQANDNPDWVEFTALMEAVYGLDHPYGRPVLGTDQHLNQQSPEKMRYFHRCHYQPQNMAVVIVGGISQQQAMGLTEQAFATFPCPEAYPVLAVPLSRPQGVRRQQLTLPTVEQTRLTLAWVGPGAEQIQEAWGLDLLSALLAEGKTSHLFRLLREELQLVYDLSSQFSLQQGSSILTISAYLEAQDLERVEALIRNHIQELQVRPISEPELLRGQRLLCNDYAFSTETPIELAGLYGYYFAIAKPELSVAYPDQIRSVQSSQLQSLAQHYLCLDHYAAVVVKPR
ncbi:MAG: insulinase family protein [Oscillatoriales cyanobacterium RM1_1_9]|nr:insulinase family protein [Oscillatoriales cyanobacterium SM2_3_0]NJO44958.1 insulinase family protein [Oscillatoriales cyanobacterium RM2_1_1]NJO71548.1 insulinase family protein [Oscillatoriales cyanobacterium RM1_1_9]